jgi:hypothetical protein
LSKTLSINPETLPYQLFRSCLWLALTGFRPAKTPAAAAPKTPTAPEGAAKPEDSRALRFTAQ